MIGQLPGGLFHPTFVRTGRVLIRTIRQYVLAWCRFRSEPKC